MPHIHRYIGRLLCLGLLCSGPSFSKAAKLPETGLAGTVKDSSGKAMEGVIVSARSENQSFTTSVYTGRDGHYYFPPLESGSYRLWAQAVSFEAARAEQAIHPGKQTPQDFTMKPMRDFSQQLSGAEWANSLPASTPEDRRMRDAFQYVCSQCHPGGYVLGKRFDAAGWRIIVNTMRSFGGFENFQKVYPEYQDDLVDYLAKVAGPDTAGVSLRPLPRPTGEATQIVVTEYEIPRGDQTSERPGHMSLHNGTDWSQGSPLGSDHAMLHDAMSSADGYVYFTDPSTPERSLGKLDPKTGRVTSYKLADAKGVAVSTHGIGIDQKGNVWMTNLTEGGDLLKFDPKTESFRRFPRSPSATKSTGTTLAIDSKGNPWITLINGAAKLNPETGEYTEYQAVTPGGHTYGITVDREDNVWFAQLEADRLGVVNSRTGEVSEVVVPPIKMDFAAKDREIAARGVAVNGVPAIYQKGPRRLNADPKGDAVWVGEFWGGNLLKVDIHTHKVIEYEVPTPAGHPYTAAVDKNHRVWVPLMNGDRIERFDPTNEKFTEYQMPTIGTNIRHISIDDSTELPTIWVPYTASNKIARVQLRTGKPF